MPVYKDEERGTYFCSFYFTDWTGERKKTTKRGFKLKREAQAYEREFLEKSQASPQMSFSSLVELYLEDMSNRLRQSTVRKKKYIIESKLLPYFGKLQIDKITPVIVRQWQNELISKDYEETYLRTIHNDLSTVFNYAVKYYNLKENPCHKSGNMGKMNAREMNFWTRDEYKLFVKSLEDNPCAHLAFQLLYWGGLRVGELLALTHADIDLESKTVSINKSYQRINKTDIITDPKTPKSNRVVMIPDFVCDEAKSYIDRLYGQNPQNRLFPFTKDYFYHKITLGCRASGVKHIRVHDIRHSHASLLIELGFSPLLIAERLGHEKVETTLNTYSHLYPNKQSELVQKLENLE